MPVLDEERVEVIEGSGAPEPTSDDFKLSEAISLTRRDAEEAASLVEAFVDGDDSERLAESVRSGDALVLDLIRPCVGRGRGKHLYKADMLEANAPVFRGWKMYLNHLSDQARRALGGLPRDVRDLGGIVQETWWNPDVPAEGRFGKGAVQAVVSPVPLVRELHRVDPRLVECSINATATACKPGKVGADRVWIVEGIEERGSVDWVTDGGAGGRVASIMEALIEDDAVGGVLDTLDNGTILAWVEEHRPELAEALRAAKGKSGSKDGGTDDGDGNDDPDADDAEMQALVKKFTGNGMPEAAARKAAARALAAKRTKGVTESEEGDEVPELTPEQLREALTSEDMKDTLAEALGPVVLDVVKGLDLGTEVVTLVERKLSESTEVIRAEAEARADRRNELRDLRDLAHRKIDETKLSPLLKEQAKAKFDLVEGAPTTALDVLDDEDAEGKVVKTAGTKIEEAVAAEADAGLKIMAEINPTRVRGQGAVALTEANEGDGGGKEGENGGQKPDRVGPVTRQLLESQGIPADKVEEVYGRSL